MPTYSCATSAAATRPELVIVTETVHIVSYNELHPPCGGIFEAEASGGRDAVTAALFLVIWRPV
jgi:hypothetical protein